MKNKMIPPPRQVPKKKPPPPHVVFTAVEQEIQGTGSIQQPETERPERVVEPKEETKTEVSADKVEQIQIEEKSEEAPAQNPGSQQVVESVMIVPGIVKKPPAPKAPIKKPGRTPPPIGRPPVISQKVEQSTPAPVVEKVEETVEEKIQATRQPTPVEPKNEQKETAIVQQPIVQQQVKEDISLPEPITRVEPEIVRVAPRPPVAAPKKAAKKPGPPPKMPAPPIVAKVVETQNKPEEAPVDSPQQQQPSKTSYPPAQTQKVEKAESTPVEQKKKEQTNPIPTIPARKGVVPIPSLNTNFKSDFLPPSQPVTKPSASAIQAPAAKSKMAEKLEQLRRAKQKMLNDDPSVDDEDDDKQFSERGINKSDEIQEEKMEVEEERREAKVEQNKPAKPQVVAKEEVPAQVITPVIVPRIAPPPVKAPIKAPGRQPPTFPQKPIPIQKPKPVVIEQPETKVEEIQTKEEKKIKQQPISEPKTETVSVASNAPSRPIISSEQPKHEFTVKVSIQQPKNSSQIKILLQRYHGLKNTYLNNLRQLDELIHFQRQQQDAEVDKINKLLIDLRKKNEAIRQICSVRELPISEGHVAV